MTDLAISEATSEKRGRGRPPAFPHELVDYQKAMFPEVRSRRGLIDLCYRAHALNAIFGASESERFVVWRSAGDEGSRAQRVEAFDPH